MRTLALSAAFAVGLSAPAVADIDSREASGSVAEAMERLTAAVEEAGATVFATIDHGAGAAEAGLDLSDSQLLVFGNPALGTPLMQEDMESGLVLPLKIFVYADADGQTHVAYEEVEDMVDDFDVDDDLDALQKMEEALERFAAAAAGT